MLLQSLQAKARALRKAAYLVAQNLLVEGRIRGILKDLWSLQVETWKVMENPKKFEDSY